MNKKILVAFFMVLSQTVLYGQKYTPTDQGSSVGFEIVNHLFGATKVNGSFTGLKGHIVFDPMVVDKASIEAMVEVSTINTGIGLRNHDLKQEKYFNAEKFPTITIRSTKIEKAKEKDEYYLDGNLTIKGTTKAIRIPFKAVPANNAYLFTSQFSINRLDFGVGEKGKIENMLIVKLKVMATK